MSFYDIEVEKSTGELVNLKEYEGKVVLIVNIASKCGYTPQLTGLQEVYERYKDDGLVILGFPCNQFLRQAPGTNTEILNFCQANYGVSFPVYGKLNVKGTKQSDLYKYLTENSPVKKGKKVKWNFEKFLINRHGEIINRYSSNVVPEYIKEDIKAIL